MVCMKKKVSRGQLPCFSHGTRKKGISAIIATVLIILVTVAAVTIIWTQIIPMISNFSGTAKVNAFLVEERMSISAITLDRESDTSLDVIVNRGATSLSELGIDNVSEIITEEITVPVDILLLVDLSGSMGWDVSPDCWKEIGGEDVNLNYPGSYCDSSESFCEQSFPCGGDYVDGSCINVRADYESRRCVLDINACDNRCEGLSGDSYVPLEVLQDAAQTFVHEVLILNDKSSIALMGFGGSNFPYLNFTDDEVKLDEAIDDWSAGGSTPLYSGLEASYDKLNSRVSDAEETVLIVLGDGDLNDLGKTVQDAIDYAAIFPADLGVNVSTIGFGPNVNVELYEGIAEKGEGIYYDSTEMANLANIFSTIFNVIEYSYLLEREIAVPGTFFDIAVFFGGDSFVTRIYEGIPGANEGAKFTIEFPDEWKLAGFTVENVTKVDVSLVIAFRGEYVSSLMASYDIK